MAPPTLLKSRLSDQKWRINHLYYIMSDMDGDPVKMIFKMTPAQEELFDNFHNKNIILKSRQHGITTFMVILMVDAIVFGSGINCGFIAQDRDSAEDIFYKKAKFAYDNLPDSIKKARPAMKNSGKELVVSHKMSSDGRAAQSTSSLRVATSLRSGTYSYIHVSEYGKICATDAKKASEIISGSLNSGMNCKVTIESTAEGPYGRFYNMCNTAMEHANRGEELTRLDYKFFFFGWMDHRASHLVCKPFEYPEEIRDRLEALDIPRTQKDWYAKKYGEQGDKMTQEYPSTPEEAFTKATHGAYYAHELALALKDGRIGSVPYNPNFKVHIAIDIGVADYCTCWFYQIVDGFFNFIDYLQIEDRSALPGLARELSQKPYAYGTLIAPHDVNVTEFGTGVSRQELAWTEYGLRFKAAPKLSKAEGIEASRLLVNKSRFDSVKCATGIAALRGYSKTFNDRLNVFVDAPAHDENSHGADAYRYAAVSVNLISTFSNDNLMLEEATEW